MLLCTEDYILASVVIFCVNFASVTVHFLKQALPELQNITSFLALVIFSFLTNNLKNINVCMLFIVPSAEHAC